MKMKRWNKIIAVVGFLVFLPMVGNSAAAPTVDIVERWAPTIYQQNIDDSATAQVNTFTLVNYDGDWRGNNNWMNLPYHLPKPTIYYSFAENATHYYIGYYAYYPRHLTINPHEHDMVGVLAAIFKNSQTLDMLVVNSHGQWRTLTGTEVQLDAGRLLLSISSGSHEIKAIRSKDKASAGGPGKVRWSYPNYQLVSVDELWQHRQALAGGDAFSQGGFMAGSASYLKEALPWSWQRHNINWLNQPAELIRHLKK